MTQCMRERHELASEMVRRGWVPESAASHEAGARDCSIYLSEAWGPVALDGRDRDCVLEALLARNVRTISGVNRSHTMWDCPTGPDGTDPDPLRPARCCEPDHPPAPSCVPGLPDTQSAQYTTHNAAGDNISVSVVGCVPTYNRCIPRQGEHVHGSVCEPDHSPAPSCVPGLPDTQSAQYTAHNQAGQNITVAVAGCVPTAVPPPPVELDDPVCDANWGAAQFASLGSRVRWESYLGGGGSPSTPEILGGSVFAHAASDVQGGTRYPAWTWLAIDGTRLNRGTLDVNDQRQGHECHWEAVGVRVEMSELIPSGGGDAEMRTLASQGQVGAAQALATAISTWDSWASDEQTVSFPPSRGEVGCGGCVASDFARRRL